MSGTGLRLLSASQAPCDPGRDRRCAVDAGACARERLAHHAARRLGRCTRRAARGVAPSAALLWSLRMGGDDGPRELACRVRGARALPLHRLDRVRARRAAQSAGRVGGAAGGAAPLAAALRRLAAAGAPRPERGHL
eukprot:5117655-Prymnesium_polylepis.2